MNDQQGLLEQLRLDRAPVVEEAGGRRRIIVGVVVVAALGLSGGALWALQGPRDEPAAAATVRVDAPTRSVPAPGNVPTAPPAPRVGASMLDASGYVVARRSATVASKIVGRVAEVAIEEGQQVEQGQVIARLDDSETKAAVMQARAQVQEAGANLAASKVALDDALPIFRRQERQLAAGVISAQAFDDAKASYNAAAARHGVGVTALEVARASLAIAQLNLEETVVRAPFSGVVTVKAAQAGEIVSPHSAGGGFTRTGICTIVDMSSLEVEVDVSENFINRVAAGHGATITLNAYPDWSIPARVIAVVPTADRSKATVKVRVGFQERDARVLPEMGARVSFLRPPALADGAKVQSNTPVSVSQGDIS